MPNSLLKRNMDYLKANFGDFYESLTKPDFAMPDLKIGETGKPGNLLLSKGDVQCNLHSVYSVEREMEMLFRPLTGESSQVIVIFGLGYGHCLDYIRKKHIKYKRVIVFEPCANILNHVLKNRGILEMLGMKDLYLRLMNVPNEMANYLLQEAMESRTVKILYHLSYMSLFRDIFDNVLRSFKNERIAAQASINTMRKLAVEWNSHQLDSLRHTFYNASELAGRFANVPGIIASAGPSLERHFDLLKEVGDRAVVVAPGSTTRIFNARGLNAHIAMSIDSNKIQAGFYRNFNLKSVLVGSHRLHSDVYENFPNKIFRVTLSTEFLTKYYYEWKGRKPFVIGDHASVSLAAVEMLFLMGCNPIILVGQDLCYHDNRNYADDASNTISEWQKRGLIPDEDIYGRRVYTDYGYKAMQNDLEIMNIGYRDKAKILNATEGGLNIHGMENVRFAEVYENYIAKRNGDVGERLAGIMEAAEKKKILSDAGFDADGNGGAAAGNENAAAGSEKTISDFFGHMLDSCSDIEKIIREKESRFASFSKLVARRVSSNRLNNEIKYIQDYNKRLFEVPFFSKVVFPNIDPSLTFLRAGSKHIADYGDMWEGASMYERALDEYAAEFINMYKALILQKIVVDASMSALAAKGEAAEEDDAASA